MFKNSSHSMVDQYKLKPCSLLEVIFWWGGGGNEGEKKITGRERGKEKGRDKDLAIFSEVLDDKS